MRGRGLLITYWQTSSSLVRLKSFLILLARLGPSLRSRAKREKKSIYGNMNKSENLTNLKDASLTNPDLRGMVLSVRPGISASPFLTMAMARTWREG